jgi:hypothetical protein
VVENGHGHVFVTLGLRSGRCDRRQFLSHPDCLATGDSTLTLILHRKLDAGESSEEWQRLYARHNYLDVQGGTILTGEHT